MEQRLFKVQFDGAWMACRQVIVVAATEDEARKRGFDAVSDMDDRWRQELHSPIPHLADKEEHTGAWVTELCSDLSKPWAMTYRGIDQVEWKLNFGKKSMSSQTLAV
jgi:hypothetical protein